MKGVFPCSRKSTKLPHSQMITIANQITQPLYTFYWTYFLCQCSLFNSLSPTCNSLVRRKQPNSLFFKRLPLISKFTGALTIENSTLPSQSFVLITSLDQSLCNSGLLSRMASIIYEEEFSLRQLFVQIPCCFRRTYNIVTPLYNGHWYFSFANDVSILNQLIGLHEAFVDEIMAFDSSESQSPSIIFST